MALSEFPRLGFDPFLELRRMQSGMNRVFSGFNAAAARDFPPVNIWLGDNSVVVTAELPGVTRDVVSISLQDEVLTLEGSRQPGVNPQEVKWHRRERAYGSFARTVQLPFRVDPEKVQARYQDGILEVELERLEADRPKKIQIRANGLEGGSKMAQEVRTVEPGSPQSARRSEDAVSRPSYVPAADIYENSDSLVVLCEMPGVAGPSGHNAGTPRPDDPGPLRRA